MKNYFIQGLLKYFKSVQLTGVGLCIFLPRIELSFERKI